MTKEKRIEIKENRKNVKQNNQGSKNPLYSWILLAHFHKPIINWLRRKLTEQN